jgi:RNA polymerase subunit RPABC4/transcription elongation factor Spt4
MSLPANIKTILSFVLMLLGAYGVLFLLSLVIWTIRDIRSRSRDVLLQILVTLLVLVFNIPGLLLYFVLRPQQTLTEAYEHALSQEAMLKDIEGRFVCPSCKRNVDAEYVVCPYCATELRKSCSSCHRPLELNWTACPYCGQKQVPDQPPAAETPAVEQNEGA